MAFFVDVFVHIVLGDEIAELGVLYKHGIFKSVITVVFGGILDILFGDLLGREHYVIVFIIRGDENRE